MNDLEPSEPTTSNKKVTWIKRIGVLGFLFFFIKGMLWLIVPAVLVWWGASH